MHTTHSENLGRAVDLLQFRLYLAVRPAPVRPVERCGQHLARLIAHDIRIVQAFSDHAWVIGRLWDSGEVETLFRVVASGLLHGFALQLYRLAIEVWLQQ